MTIKEALKQVVSLYGKEELMSRRLVNLLSDYQYFGKFLELVNEA